jgi:maltose-binding protein MalE
MQSDDLISLKDDMVAFIEGHAMRRLPGFVTEDLPTVLWEDDKNPDSWKDFVEMAKTTNTPFVTMSEIKLEKGDIGILLEQIREEHFPDVPEAEMQEAQYLINYVGKIGYIQLGFAYQGVMFVHENATEWYERYQQLQEFADDFGNMIFEDDEDEDEE